MAFFFFFSKQEGYYSTHKQDKSYWQDLLRKQYVITISAVAPYFSDKTYPAFVLREQVWPSLLM